MRKRNRLPAVHTFEDSQRYITEDVIIRHFGIDRKIIVGSSDISKIELRNDLGLNELDIAEMEVIISNDFETSLEDIFSNCNTIGDAAEAVLNHCCV